MAGGKSRPKKDISLKVSQGQIVKPGQILSRGLSVYRAGINVKGLSTLHALCAGKVSFRKKKTPGGKVRTFIDVLPIKNPN
ncbi:MAG: 50S ribosomal protein L27 [Candidatus Omnitrophica bacterium]|nr:50S ribosomal protein L27 [Candidatus Omnitrophota bacterium]